MNTPLWPNTHPGYAVPLPAGEHVDVAVVGATTAKTTLLQSTRLSALGLPTVLHDHLTTPFPVHAAVLPEQIQLNPTDLLSALCRAVTDAGATITEHARITRLQSDARASRVEIGTSAGALSAGQMVLATATPILDQRSTSMELVAQRSYLCAFEPSADAVVPDGMFIGAERTHGWSAQDYHPVSMVPMIETLSWGEGLVRFAGGLPHIGHDRRPCRGSWRRRPRARPAGAGEFRFAVHTRHGAAAARCRGRPGGQCGPCTHPEPGRERGSGGSAPRRRGHRRWAGLPVHGSRFTAGGTLLEGPAVNHLERR